MKCSTYGTPVTVFGDGGSSTQSSPRVAPTSAQGNLYLSGPGSQERLSLLPLHDETRGVVIALHCFELHDEHLQPENVDFCDALNATANRHMEYPDLMNTTFGLVPAGRSPSTYRLAEVMSAGAIPVIVAKDYVPPFPERVDWKAFSFTFPPEDVSAMMLDTLQAVPIAELREMQVGQRATLGRERT